MLTLLISRTLAHTPDLTHACSHTRSRTRWLTHLISHTHAHTSDLAHAGSHTRSHACRTTVPPRQQLGEMKARPLCLVPVLVLAGLWMQFGESVQAPVLSGPDMAYLDSRIEFRCEAPGLPQPVSYQLLRDGGLVVNRTPEDNQPATFQLRVSNSTGGRYHCRVRVGGSAQLPPLSSNTIHLRVVIPVRGAGVVSDPDPPVLAEGEMLALSCQVQRGSHLSYLWFFNQKEISGDPRYLVRGNALVIAAVSESDAGSYYCRVANALANTRVSNSPEVPVRVKVFLSEPQVSFTVSKSAWGYHANVTCRSSRGTPPVCFWLFLDQALLGNRTAASLSASFSVPVTPGQSAGELRCRARDQLRKLDGPALRLEVVPVGGDVHLWVEYLYSVDSRAVGVRLHCAVGRGTFPMYAWFLNNTLLEREGDSYIITKPGHTLLLTSITPQISGYYHCQAKDSFDNSSWILSQKALVHTTGLGVVSSEVIAIMFCLFLLLGILGSVCCIFALSNREVDSHLRTRSSAFALSAVRSRSEVTEAESSSSVTP
ncbi:Fc receptor-like protein 3 isoform X2 [Megalops cyprinoides]|uniref:Fc receptor-like protein 3 isoform X2 n=1 Tax=Megalops cyprinoides TaxID=118141 RepID=UPI0018654DA9|nr:Fc receptor-like protein 3 isoform X2 [Megalops cyprinoides]